MIIDNDIAIKDEVKNEFSVSEISSKIKDLLESNFGYLRVKGEISGLKIAASGHAYFNLKDNSSVLACICWRFQVAKLSFPLKDGLEVVVTGKLTSYSGQSKYQLMGDSISLAGLGAIMQILKERRQKLEKEGVFDSSRKKPLPFIPRKIGVVTSITGAVIRDIIHRITERFPTNIVIWPVAVQGESSAFEVTEAINGFNSLQEKDRPDVIIVARGGGSIEDLWPFNEEIVVYAARDSSIPIISAVGHETDYTLLDFVADKRAPTPTAAAEFAVPVLSDIKYTLNLYYNKLLHRVIHVVKYKQQILSGHKILKYPINQTNFLQQRLDEQGFRLNESLPKLLKVKAISLEKSVVTKFNVERVINYKTLQLSQKIQQLYQAINYSIKNYGYKLNMSTSLLQSLDYVNVLKRGYAIVKSDDGHCISLKSATDNRDNLQIQFYDGSINVKKM